MSALSIQFWTRCQHSIVALEVTDLLNTPEPPVDKNYFIWVSYILFWINSNNDTVLLMASITSQQLNEREDRASATSGTRDFYAKEMTPAQIEKAEKLASECVAKKYKGC